MWSRAVCIMYVAGAVLVVASPSLPAGPGTTPIHCSAGGCWSNSPARATTGNNEGFTRLKVLKVPLIQLVSLVQPVPKVTTKARHYYSY